MTDAGLAHLKPLSLLRVLNLNGTKVTDAGLKYLEGFDCLRMLYLYDCKVGNKGVNKFKKKMSGLAVYYDLE